MADLKKDRLTSKNLALLQNVCAMPFFAAPWVHRFYTHPDIELLTVLAEGPLTSAELSRQFAGRSPSALGAFLRRAWRRGVIARLADNCWAAADFHVRYEYWALFEGWQDLPDDVRAALNQWEMAAYLRKHAAVVQRLKAGHPRPPEHACPEYLLLHEAEALLDRVAHIYLWPCNCRAMIGACGHSHYTCLRFDNERDIGWEISRGRAKAIVREANRRGLMQSAELRLDAAGCPTGALCNCCPDCCFPHRLALEKDAQRVWPLSRYTLRPLMAHCNGCGRCAQRCPFNAIVVEKSAKNSTGRPAVDAGRCRGCGLCAAACKQDALTMVRTRRSLFEAVYGVPEDSAPIP